jgi:hypothetical protein
MRQLQLGHDFHGIFSEGMQRSLVVSTLIARFHKRCCVHVSEDALDMIEVLVLVATESDKPYNHDSSSRMASPPEEQQPQASTSQQGQSNAAGAPAAGQAGPRKAMKEMSKGQLARFADCTALSMSSY